jgi:predicted anti-sigma-YlaC factor YlaD
MRCSRYRQALSARLDGEDPGLPIARLDAHLGSCAGCRDWAVSAGSLANRVGDAPAGQPDLNSAVLATLLQGARPRRTFLSLGEWRVVLALVATLQLVVAWLDTAFHQGEASGHLAHELTSWDAGLGIGFLLLAWMPSRAWGALPVVAALVAALVGTSAADLLTGHALVGRELVHALELAGLGCLWVLARRVPRSSVVLRLA